MPSHNRGHLTWVFLILDEGYLLPAAAPGLRHGLAGLGRLPNLRQGVAPLGHASARFFTDGMHNTLILYMRHVQSREGHDLPKVKVECSSLSRV